MEIIICLLIGYLLGCLSPAAVLGKRKNVDLRETGTHNLGASNAVLVLGKSYGFVVMVVDIVKAYLSAKIARLLFPKLVIAGMVAGLGAIIGHMFPFYLNFRGGKGLAAYGGMVLAFEPGMFLFFIVTGLVLMVICNVTVVLPIYAALLFPVLVWFRTGNAAMVMVAAVASVILILRHRGNVRRARAGEDLDVRAYIADLFRKNA